MIRTYNSFYKWVSEDDFLTWWPWVIDSSNIDWIQNWYGAVLWPKSNKEIQTNVPIHKIYYNDSVSWKFQLVWHDATKSEVYEINSADNTPVIEITSADTAYYKIKGAFEFKARVYFIWYNASESAVQLHRVVASWVWNKANWAFDYSTQVEAGNFIPVMTENSSYLFIWFEWVIKKFDSSWVETRYTFPVWYVRWITFHWTQIGIYSYSNSIGGYLSYWDWEDTVASSVIKLWYSPLNVLQDWNIDYSTDTDWETYVWSGYNSQKRSSPNISNRLNDNSQFINKLDFWVNTRKVATGLIAKLWDIYWISNDTTKWIYKYWKIIEWLAPSPNKIITANYSWDDFIEIYDQIASPSMANIYYSYETSIGYYVDYINTTSRETAKDWYIVTEVFSWGTSYKKKLNNISYATSNTSWNNYIKFYYRVDNWTWKLFNTVNNATDTIARQEMSNWVTGEFVDIQIKVELHNDNQDEISPILHELQIDYDIL